jgi:dipeptidyl aminopeptidase/acylaminoacyl peptidase
VSDISTESVRSKAFCLPPRKLLLGLGLCFLVGLIFFWKEILVSSPLFFGYRGKDLFGIYTARLDGGDFHPLLLDEHRELSHARLSPDGKRITFTRYNKMAIGGFAEENGSNYLHTEIVVMNSDGSSQQSIEPTGPEILNANSSWIDNDSLIYVHRQDLKSLPELRVHHLSSKTTTRLPTPPGVAVADPTCVKQRVVFPVIPLTSGNEPCCLWAMNLDGSGLRQVTKPAIIATSSILNFKLGDYDPWLSPDGKNVAFMRYFGDMDWRIYSCAVGGEAGGNGIANGAGSDHLLSKAGVPSGIPKWSGDGRAILYVSWDKSKLENLGLYTMRATGQENKKIPLPGGYLYTHPSFFPGSGAGSKSAIIFSARRVPGLPGRNTI